MRIGVTGNFASGKGTVCAIFSEFGSETIDTDIIARNIVLPGSQCLEKIINAFGKQFMLPDGSLDRRSLGSFVFEDENRVSTLNSIMHPEILKETLRLSADICKIYTINAPVLFESGFDRYMDLIIVVSSSSDQSINRGICRDGLSSDEIKQRLTHQISLNEKMKKADYVIDNSGTIDNTRKQVKEIWNSIITKNRE